MSSFQTRIYMVAQIHTVTDLKSLCLTSKLFRDQATSRLYTTACVQAWNSPYFDSFFKSYENGASIQFRKTAALIVEDEKPPAEAQLKNPLNPIEISKINALEPDVVPSRNTEAAISEDVQPLIGPKAGSLGWTLLFYYKERQ
jgi:hypothetical protein